MEPITIWTALQAILTLAVPVGAYVITRMRAADIKMIDDMQHRMETLYTTVQAKLDKADHQRSLDKIDREMADLRSAAERGQAEIRQDIKDLRQDIMLAIRDAKNQ